MTPNEQEARSVRYVRGAVVVPLRSGAWALFSRVGDELLSIAPSLGDLEQAIRKQSKEAQEKHRAGASRGRQQVLVGTLDELGL